MSARLFAIVGALMLVGAGTATSGTTLPRYDFSFSVAMKPGDTTSGFARVVVNGSGSGSFQIWHRQVDRDSTIFWHLKNAKGSVSLSAGGHVFLSAEVVGGTFGTEKVTGGLLRSTLLTLKITSSTRFRCAKPDATLGLNDSPQLKGNQDSLSFDACGAQLRWDAVPPGLVVHVARA